MTALFTVRLAAASRLLSFDEAGLHIAQAKFPPKAEPDETDDVIAALEHVAENERLLAAVIRGDIEFLDIDLHPMAPPFTRRKLERAKVTADDFRQYVESIKGAVETDDEQLPGDEPTLNGVKLSQIYADQMAHRHAANCFDIVEAAKAIAVQLGYDTNEEEALRDDMGQAAFDGALVVRSPRGHDQYAPTSPPRTTYGFDSLTTPDDVNQWATERKFKWRWHLVSQATTPSPATPAPVVADGSAKPRSNKSEKTLIFEAKVLELMGKFWNDRTPGTEPTKSDLCKLVYDEILRTPVRGSRKTTRSMVNDAAKPWKIPIVLPAMVPDSKFNDKRHPFKGDK